MAARAEITVKYARAYAKASKKDKGRACQVVCVSGHRLGGCSEVGVDSVGERDRELGQRLLPAGRDGALDQPRWRFSLV